MVSVNFRSYEYVTPMPVVSNAKQVKFATSPTAETTSAPNTTPVSKTEYNPVTYKTELTVKTTLATKEEKQKYNELSEVLDAKYRRKLEYALKTGILLKNNSDDRSSVLDNLHKILKEERDKGLDGRTILKECLDIIHNPYVITQKCEDIPDDYKTPVIGLVTNMSEDVNEITGKFQLWRLD